MIGQAQVPKELRPFTEIIERAGQHECLCPSPVKLCAFHQIGQGLEWPTLALLIDRFQMLWPKAVQVAQPQPDGVALDTAFDPRVPQVNRLALPADKRAASAVEAKLKALFAPMLAECEQKGTPGLILQEAAIAVPALHLALERKSHVEFARRLLDILDVSRAQAIARALEQHLV